MDKPVIIKFDKEAYREYEELQEAVSEGKKSKKKPTYYNLKFISPARGN